MIEFTVHLGQHHPSIDFHCEWLPGVGQARMVAEVLVQHLRLEITKDVAPLPGEEHISLRGRGMEVEVFSIEDGFDLHLMKSWDAAADLLALVNALEASGKFVRA